MFRTLVPLVLMLSACTEQEIRPIDISSERSSVSSYIVVLDENNDLYESDRLAQRYGINRIHKYDNSIKGFSARMPLALVSQLEGESSVLYIEEDSVISLGPPPGKGPNKDNPDDSDGCSSKLQVTPYGTTMVGGPIDGTGLVAWVIDTGIKSGKCDLNVDSSRGGNFISRGKNTTEDGHGHGTHVAGTIGALDNEIDIVGVAPGATVIPIRVLDNRGSGTISSVIAGVDFVTANASSGDVANMSLGGSYSLALNEAVEASADSGVIYTIAAGNSSDDASFYSPASAEHENIYTISAIDKNGDFASFSNYGSPVDYAAPGVDVESLRLGDGTVKYNGTSMAAPHAAGVLLFGEPSSSGSAANDPDGNPDPIIHF